MEFLFFESLRDSAYQHQVYELLKQCDHEFVPPLSQRTSTTQSTLNAPDTEDFNEPGSYFQTLCGQSVILAVEQEQVLGFMSFIGQHICEDAHDQILTVYVTTIIVDPAHRGKGITRHMYRQLMALAPLQARPISTRTWSTNGAHIKVLSQLGFYELLRIPNGRGQGIDTVYYRKDRFHHEKENGETAGVPLAET